MFNVHNNDGEIIDTAAAALTAGNVVQYLDRAYPQNGPHYFAPENVEVAPVVETQKVRRSLRLLRWGI